ncbi:ABC transporter ATP-binding protein [Microbacterium sp. JB110]|uniref:ABC transporter ATP-binding protein n=1 Tax=Microbacterium sp. JB110 TaxID=2024477 RepID=UPI00097F001C|nr:ABC transporter ATP-binding protein [Microbacterium sp. JB110]RCS63206.1 ABC transporter ATP-binding protein [Microbacterium sp. JB110]SJM52390.1 Methionine ABC transporter ATP-binding protein [Frigoribacterium sp. JB110]
MSRSHTGDARLPLHRALLRLLPFAKADLPRIGLGGLSALCASIVALMIPTALEWIVGGPLSTGQTEPVVWGALAVLGLGLVEAVMVWLRRWFVLAPSASIEYNVRTRFYNRLQRLPIEFHDRWQGGQLLSRMMQDIGQIRRWLAFGLIMLVVNLLTVLIGAALLFQWHWALGSVFLVSGIPVFVQAFRFERRYGMLTRRSQDQQGDLATSVEESVHGIRVLKAFGRGPDALTRFTRQAEGLRSTEMSKARSIAVIDFVLVFMPELAFAACLALGIWLAQAGELEVSQLFAYFAMATILRWPMESIGFLFSFLLDTRTATDRIFEVFDSADTITEPEAPVALTAPRGELRFEGVRFRYQDARSSERDLLDGVDLAVAPGETMALVGLTGSGKTTLTTLPTRLYDVTGGRVTLDGVDVRDLSIVELRTRIATAFEDATLFSATVRENVLLGRDDLDISSSEAGRVMREALEVSQAEFVEELPDGVSTMIGEEGMSLSGGQRQRLALARAVAARPSVIVMDDPLSALDVDTEERVQGELRRVLAGTTALIVAHRPSTVALADRVALLEHGRITAVGAHTDLMASSAGYRAVISSIEHTDDASRDPNPTSELDIIAERESRQESARNEGSTR